MDRHKDAGGRNYSDERGGKDSERNSGVLRSGKRTNQELGKSVQSYAGKIGCRDDSPAQRTSTENEESVDIVVEQAYEIKRLRMENELLRDFLHFTERE